MRHVSILRHVVIASRWASTARPRPHPSRAVQSRPKPVAEPVPIDPTQPIDEPTPSSNGSTSVKSRAIPWALASLMAAALGFYGVSLYIAANQPCHNPQVADLSKQKDVAGRYDYTADSFDSEVGLSEVLMMVNSLRKQLARKCTGHVLEVSCGTGRNLGYYDLGKEGQVDSLTFVDLSPQMIEVCRKKWDAFFAGKGKERLKPGLSIRFLAGSALDDMPLAPVTGKKYDTIVQTMGLCSTATPTELLENIAKHLDTSNTEARILLLEHGRSYMPWMNRILDNAAEKHAELHGCWFNRDIGALVQEAAQQSGLEIVNERRYHFGTTWMFELRPKPEIVERAKSATPPTPAEAASKAEQPVEGSGSWFGWLGQK